MPVDRLDGGLPAAAPAVPASSVATTDFGAADGSVARQSADATRVSPRLTPQPGYRDVLRNGEFRALWAAHVTSVLGDQVTRVALASLVLARTGSVALTALSVATTYLPWLLGGPLLGVLADRCPRRTVMVVCDVARGLLLLLMSVPAVPVWALLLLAAGSAVLGPPFEAARGAMLPDVLAEDQYATGQALSMAGLQVAQLLGFALGGLLLTVAPGVWTLRLDAATFLLSALVIRRTCRWRAGADSSVASTPARWLRDGSAGAVVVGRSPELRRLLAFCCLTAAVSIVPEGLAVAESKQLGGSPLTAGLLSATIPLGAAVGAVLLGRFVAPDRRLALVRPLGLLSALALAATLLLPGLSATAVLWVVCGIGAACQMPANVAFVLRLDPTVRGRALSIAQVLLQGSQGLAIALGGVLAGHLDAHRAVGWTGVLGLVVTGALTLRWPAGLRVPRSVPAARPARPPAFGAVRALTVVVLAAAGGLWWTVGRSAGRPTGPLDLTWWELMPAVMLAQAGVVYFQVRRQAQSITLCHLPVVIGLICCGPAAFVVARVGGGVLGMAVLRRQRGIKLALNTASYLLEAVVAVCVLHALASWPLPAAVYVVMAAADLTSFTVVGVAIMVFERRLDATAWLRPLTWLMPINLTATSFALLAVAALWRGIGYLPILGGITVCLLLFYRTYAGLRDRHVDQGRLQQLAATLPALTRDGPELPDVLEQARVLLVAERLELWLADGAVLSAVQDELASWSTAPGVGRPEAVRTKGSDRRPRWSRLTADVSYAGGLQGATLVISDHLGEWRLFDRDDARLLGAVAALVSGGLDRGWDRQRMLDVARKDPLTGLWNLPEAARLVGAALRGGEPLSLVIIDIIGLQDVNDSMGHDAGDALLQIAARRLQRAVGGGVTARIGGDELLAVLGPDAPSVASVLARTGGAVELAGLRLELRLRAGFCASEDGGGSFELLLRNAQAALARAAANGSRYRAWSAELSVDPSRRLLLAGDLQQALAGGDLFAVFQPLVRCADMVVVGAEALARWNHPQLGAVPPDEFIAIAEQTGLITELTRVVLAAALRQARLWREGGDDIRVSVNLSPRSLSDSDLVEIVDEALTAHGLPASALLLEITESGIMSDVDQAVAVLSRLQARGIEIALDDFGTGHSSLAHLRSMPVSEVKLDRSFLRDMTGDLSAQKIVVTAVALCHDLGKTVVAEGVEDEATAALLRAAGVDLLQGYHLGRPLPAQQWSPSLVTRGRLTPAGAVPGQSVPGASTRDHHPAPG